MLAQITLLLVCQVFGEAFVQLAGLPVPGPVVGMLALLLLLFLRGGVGDALQQTAGGLLDHLSLLFVPAGVGAIVYLPLVLAEWPAILASVVISTVLTIAVTARVMTMLERPADGERQ